MVSSKILGGGDGAAYIFPNFQKHLNKYKFSVPTVHTDSCVAYSYKVTILSGG